MTHAVKVLAYGLEGFNPFANWQLLLPLLLAVIVGTWLGKHLNGKLPDIWFNRLTTAVLAILAVKLFYDGVSGIVTAA